MKYSLSLKAAEALKWLGILSPLWLMPLAEEYTMSLLKPFVGWNYAGYCMFLSSGVLLGGYVVLHAVLAGTNSVRLLLSIILAVLVNLYYSFNHCLIVWNCYYPKFPSNIYGFPAFWNQLSWAYIGSALVPLCATGGACLYVWNNRKAFVGMSWKTSSEAIPDTHGSARLSNAKEIEALNNPEGIPVGTIPKIKDCKNPLEVANTIKISSRVGKQIRLKANHGIVVASSGAGKGIGIVIPTLLDYKGPVLVTDIKGENYEVTARHRRSLGRRVVVYDPHGNTDEKSLEFNLLDLLDIDNEDILDQLAIITELICPVPENASGATEHFVKRAQSLIKMVILYVLYSCTFPQKDKNLLTVYDILSSEKKLITLAKKVSKDTSIAYGALARAAGGFLSTKGEEQSGVITTSLNCFGFLESQAVRKTVTNTTFNPKEMMTGLVDLFICIAGDKIGSLAPLLRVLVGLPFVYAQQREDRQKKGIEGPHKLLMLLDEMPAMGYISYVKDALRFGRGYGIQVLGITQTLESIKNVYPESYQNFLSSDLRLFFGVKDLQTAKYVSEMLGSKTILNISENKGTSQQSRLKSAQTRSESEGESMSFTGRPLLMPDEIIRLDDQAIIIFKEGSYPILCRRNNYLIDPYWRGKFDQNSLETRDKATA